ncbi:L,D-transpeptidase family protein [Stappia sediminis]|nr:L,D-transpeptidase family protein [Stappia sediminis]
MLVSSAPAEAQGFLDRLFNPKHYDNGQRRAQEPVRREIPKVRVSGPRYYTYEPDRLKTADLASLGHELDAYAQALETRLEDEARLKDRRIPHKGTADAPVIRASLEVRSPAGNFIADPAFLDARGVLKRTQVRALPEVIEAIEAYYATHPAFVWIMNGMITEKAVSAVNTMSEAAQVGLDPADYRVAFPSLDGVVDKAARQAELMRFEMELSAAALTYSLDAARGRIDPNRISGYHDLPRKEVDLKLVMGSIAATDDVYAYLQGRSPSNPQFVRLIRALAKLKEADEGERVEIAEDTFLRPGGKSIELKNVIAAIGLKGSDDLKTAHADTLGAYDGGEDYTPELVAVLKDFQAENGLTADGIIGKNTIRALEGISNADKIEKVKLAMERLRWLPRDFGPRYVFINQPAFTATYMSEERDPLSMRVVVGQKSNQTYFFSDKIETVEYNPYWGVPYSIIVNEMLPKLAQDPSYLDRIGYEVSTVSGRQVSSASVDWYAVAQKRQPINVRQRPGSDNALGELKILFPNKHAIYMHDTPAKRLFKKDARAFSHGCVRLEDPRAMAAAVLGKPLDYIGSRIAQGRNDSDPVTRDIPVHVAYFTAWPEPDGSMGYYADVYERDEYLKKAIEATQAARS